MICRACGLYLLFFCVTASSATAQFKARLLTKGEIDAAQISADPVRMPGIAGPVRINEAQAFSIEGSGFAKLLMVPVRYAWHDKEPARPTNSDMCGVFLIRSESVRQFIQTVGMGWLDVFNCNSLEAVGFLAGEAGGPPRIILLYSANSPHDIEDEPVVLEWNAASQGYVWNENVSQQLATTGNVNSVSDMKRLLLRKIAH